MLSVLAMILIINDLRYRSVPMILFLIFSILLFINGWGALHWNTFVFGCVLSLVCYGAECYLHRSLAGVADKILLPILFFNIPISNLGLYMMVAGMIGVGFSFWWQKLYNSAQFPFLPALIIPSFLFMS